MKLSIKYHVNIKALSEDEGNGYLVEYPELPGCIADGETIEEALRAGEDAAQAWIATAKAEGATIPKPKFGGPTRT